VPRCVIGPAAPGLLPPARRPRRLFQERREPAPQRATGRQVVPNAFHPGGGRGMPAPSSQWCLLPRRPKRHEMTVLRLCPSCGEPVDPAAEGHRGPCRRCERERSRQRRAAGEPGVLIRSTAKWQRTRTAVLRRDGDSCTSCSARGKLEVHHVQPSADGGEAFDLRNLVTLCPRCHHEQQGRAPVL
jgi:5-methylcytosine-specific restriction endonuclease McrA